MSKQFDESVILEGLLAHFNKLRHPLKERSSFRKMDEAKRNFIKEWEAIHGKERLPELIEIVNNLPFLLSI